MYTLHIIAHHIYACRIAVYIYIHIICSTCIDINIIYIIYYILYIIYYILYIIYYILYIIYYILYIIYYILYIIYHILYIIYYILYILYIIYYMLYIIYYILYIICYILYIICYILYIIYQRNSSVRSPAVGAIASFHFQLQAVTPPVPSGSSKGALAQHEPRKWQHHDMLQNLKRDPDIKALLGCIDTGPKGKKN